MKNKIPLVFRSKTLHELTDSSYYLRQAKYLSVGPRSSDNQMSQFKCRSKVSILDNITVFCDTTLWRCVIWLHVSTRVPVHTMSHQG